MEIEKKMACWLKVPFDSETQQAVQSLANGTDSEALHDAFYKDLSFGTGGMRGKMGVGTNRINKYTLGRCSQGLATYLLQEFPSLTPKVVIAFDSRHNSQSLAQEVANVLTANGVAVYLFTDLRTTPELSFAVRHLRAQAGIVLTASHNPPIYNGYKVYWEDGAQIVPPHDQKIMEAIDSVSYESLQFGPPKAKIHPIDLEVDEAYWNTVLKLLPVKPKQPENLNVVFTPLHGTAITAVPRVLQRAGFDRVSFVKEQMHPDGDFPTVKSPNPEEREALSLAIDQANDQKADLVIGTDPDCDRLGVAFRTNAGSYQLLNGNQLMLLLTDFVLDQLQQKNKLLPSSFIASTIVSTPLMQSIATQYQIECVTTLTGFKWIGEAIENRPSDTFICGGEESYGFLLGSAVRDKDAVSASLLAAVMTSQLKSEGKSLLDQLILCYQKYGFQYESLHSLNKEGAAGAKAILEIMHSYRNNPPRELGGNKVVKIYDYQTGVERDLKNNSEIPLVLPKANVLIFVTSEGSRIALRPSGTEPKIKFYLSVANTYQKEKSWEYNLAKIEKQLKILENDLPL
ncbi:MAG TPA: phosphoglucomutase [Flavobacteriaceae bacterium]|nr:phosphoglucomutase [Flavobacteriaceae bacterium]|tara:strand:+ start:6057 stop:7766 length:1710 start_codon:yes stop_codon:yes gene_type:complete